jgi:single-strand DNA-binding protein
MLNKVVLIGRLTKDPEIRNTTSGIPVGTFTLAVNRNYTAANGEREADFLNCVCYRKLAENVGRYVHKGSLVSVDGRIQTRTYDAQDGTKRYVTEIICDNVVFLDTRQQGESNYNQNSNNNNYYQPQQQPAYNQQNRNNNPMNNQYASSNNNYSQPQDDFFDNKNIDISEDDLPF